MTDCIAIEQLRRFLLDDLSGSESRVISEHVDQCIQCQMELDGLTNLSEIGPWASTEHENETASLTDQITRLAASPPLFRNTPQQHTEPDLYFLTPADDPNSLGMLLHYKITRVLGFGGMGVVLQGWDTVLERDVAIKVLHTNSASRDSLRRFLREARAVAGLKHDNIVSVYSIHDEHATHPFMCMELVQGISLEEEIARSSRLAPRRAATIALQVSRGMQTAHRAGVIHRDIKPSNILLDERTQRARLTDFGLAVFAEQAEPITRDGAVLGTVAYMSPEQFSLDAKTEFRSDIYSLGITLYEMLAGQTPFKGTLHQIINQVRTTTPNSIRNLNPEVPKDLETIVSKCIETEPKQRYPTAAELADDLQRFLDGKPIMARPISKPEAAWRWCRRRPVAAAAIMLTCILAVAGPITAVYQSTLRNQIGRLIAKEYFELAKSATARGQFRDAERALDRAMEAGFPDPDQIRVEQAQLMMSLGDLSKAKEKLRALLKEDLGDHLRGRAMLLHGELLIMIGDSGGIESVEASLKYPLSNADHSFAKALLADTPQKSMDQLKATLELDPFHYSANGMLTMALIQTGQLDAAMKRAVASSLIFPEDPNFTMVQAVIHAIERDLDSANETLEISRGQLNEMQLVGFEDAQRSIRQIAEAIDLMDSWEVGNTFAEKATKLLRFYVTGWNQRNLDIGGDASQDSQHFTAPLLLKIPPVFTKHYQDFEMALTNWTGNRREQALDEIKAIIDAGAISGEMHFTHGLFLMIDHNWDLERWLAAEKAFLAAADANSMWPNVRREAVYIAAMCGGAALTAERRQGIPESPDHLKRAIELVSVRLELGPLQISHARNLYQLCLEAEEWELCRRILNDVRHRHPDDLKWQKDEFQLDLYSGNYFSAWLAASTFLETHPEDKDAARVISKAKSQILNELNTVPSNLKDSA